MGRPANTLKVFWSRVDKRKGKNACWPWTAGNLDIGGYGRMRMSNRYIKAPRIAYATLWGVPLPGQVVRHTCDNPICCRPKHLKIGTAADNMMDKSVRRRIHGERNPNVKLRKADIAVIKRRRRRGETYAAIAADYGVNLSTIYKIWKGQKWT